MHNIKWIKDNAAKFDDAMVRRGLAPVSDRLLANDKEKRGEITILQDLQQKSNTLAKKIGELKSKGEDAGREIEESKIIKEKMAELKSSSERKENLSADLLNCLLYTLPNILDDDVPEGNDDADNIKIRTWGNPKSFDFKPKEHFELGENLGLLDFEQTAKISGSRFSTLKGDLAKMERALSNFMLDIQTKEFGFMEISPPLLVRADALIGTSQLPKFEDDLFKVGVDHYLIPTAEVPLANLVSDMILDEAELPLRFAANTPCFRAEAGAAGRDTRGLIRQHQFSKVELVSITTPEESASEHERITNAAEEILKRLNLPYRVMLLCSGDTGFGSRRTYDLEVWLSGQNHYREISSCSNCGEFQARRMNSRFRPKDEKETRFVHTLNGSGLAIGRTIVAILENYQNEDGSITIPEALRPYMEGQVTIT